MWHAHVLNPAAHLRPDLQPSTAVVPVLPAVQAAVRVLEARTRLERQVSHEHVGCGCGKGAARGVLAGLEHNAVIAGVEVRVLQQHAPAAVDVLRPPRVLSNMTCEAGG